MWRLLFTLVFVCLAASCAHIGRAATVPAQTASLAARSPDDAFLDGLVGDWDMTGDVRGKPVRYRAQGVRVLGGAWLEFRMIDASETPPYEASVFIGADAGAHDYVAHWLDRFGAAGARVAASGTRNVAVLVLVYPYADGAFRNTWTAQTEGVWTLEIEAQGADGAWSHFAAYRLTRR